MQDPSARSLVSLSPSIGMTRLVLFSETRSTARLWLRLRRSAQGDRGAGCALLGQNDRETFQNKFLTVALKQEKKASPAGLPSSIMVFGPAIGRRARRGLQKFNPGPSEIQSWAFRNSRSEMPAKREYYHSSLFFACISPTAPQAMTPRRMAASTTKTMICQSGMRYPITSPFMALELASE